MSIYGISTSLRRMAVALLDPTFQYATLSGSSDIRIVVLYPGKGDEPVRCKLMHVALDRRPQYEALSYAWGDTSQPRRRIFLDDKEFNVTANLEAALLNLRDESVRASKSRSLWIDAICINQNDILERNAQVRRMTEIYSRASRVLIWLGRYHEPEDDELGFPQRVWGFANLHIGTEETTSRVFELAKNLAGRLNGSLQVKVLPDECFETISKEEVADLRRLLRRSWFGRLWVVQELLVARDADVICGRQTISWVDFEYACHLIDMKSYHMPWSERSELGRLLMNIGIYRLLGREILDQNSDRCLLSLLYGLHDAECIDPRDRLYGLLAVCSDGAGVEVDYLKEVGGVYTDWAWSRISQTRKLDVFNASTGPQSMDLPSWVPDLSQISRKAPVDWILFSTVVTSWRAETNESQGCLGYCSSGLSLCNPRLSKDRKLLFVSGLFVDRVTAVLDGHPYRKALDTGLKTAAERPEVGFRTYLLFAIEALEIQVTKHFGLSKLSYDSSLWKEFTDVLFRGVKKITIDKLEDTEGLRDRYATWRGFTPVPNSFQRDMPEGQRRTEYLAPLESHLVKLVEKGIQFFATSNGRLGLTTVTCKIYILFGGDTPYILRQEGKAYHLISPCYLHAFMDGEAIAGWRIGKYKTEEITLA